MAAARKKSRQAYERDWALSLYLPLTLRRVLQAFAKQMRNHSINMMHIPMPRTPEYVVDLGHAAETIADVLIAQVEGSSRRRKLVHRVSKAIGISASPSQDQNCDFEIVGAFAEFEGYRLYTWIVVQRVAPTSLGPPSRSSRTTGEADVFADDGPGRPTMLVHSEEFSFIAFTNFKNDLPEWIQRLETNTNLGSISQSASLLERCVALVVREVKAERITPETVRGTLPPVVLEMYFGHWLTAMEWHTAQIEKERKREEKERRLKEKEAQKLVAYERHIVELRLRTTGWGVRSPMRTSRRFGSSKVVANAKRLGKVKEKKKGSSSMPPPTGQGPGGVTAKMVVWQGGSRRNAALAPSWSPTGLAESFTE